MRDKMNKKGLVSGIIVISILFFLTVLFGLLSLSMWNMFEESIEDVGNETIQQESIDKIKEYRDKMLWTDKLVVIYFLVLLGSYLFTSATLPSDQPAFLLIFFGFLVFTTVMTMIMTNAWQFMLQYDLFGQAVKDMSFTNFFMTYFPVITFITGLVGGIIFYGRRNSGGGGGNIAGIE